MQSNRFLDGKEVYFLGTISQNCNFKSIEDGAKLVLELDELISTLLIPVFNQGLIPIIIGGGHNNAYPILNSQFMVTSKKVEVINLDPHADCRALEGRHSGNAFSYATKNGYLEHYSVLGLHKGYNNAKIYSFLDEHQYFYRFFEDYMDDATLFEKDIDTVCQPTDFKLGIELDLDAIKNMPSSACTPSGFTIEEARIFIRKLARSSRKIAYMHIPEGAPISKKEELLVGKTISYLIYDFITSELSK
jgi:formiminoglutamase